MILLLSDNLREYSKNYVGKIQPDCTLGTVENCKYNFNEYGQVSSYPLSKGKYNQFLGTNIKFLQLDFQQKKYLENWVLLIKYLDSLTIEKPTDNFVFISGHQHNLGQTLFSLQMDTVSNNNYGLRNGSIIFCEQTSMVVIHSPKYSPKRDKNKYEYLNLDDDLLSEEKFLGPQLMNHIDLKIQKKLIHLMILKSKLN